MNAVSFTGEEARALYELIDELAGGNAPASFIDAPDVSDPAVRASAKLYLAAGRPVPRRIERALREYTDGA